MLLTVLSIAFAEVSIGSAPFGLLNPAEFVFLSAVYGGHLLLLGAYIFRRNRQPTLAALWSAGAIFGMYEFYLTKVLWDQPWDGVMVTQGIEVLATIVLVGFWHPFMSFILPLMVGEQLLVEKPHIAGLFPRWLHSPKRWVAVGLLLTVAVNQGAFTANPGVLLVVIPWTALMLVVAARRLAPDEKLSSLGDILPTGRALGLVALVVGATYALFTPLWRPEVPIPVDRQMLAWMLYAVLAIALHRNLRNRADPPAVRLPTAAITRRRVLLYLAVAVIASILPPAVVFGIVTVWGVTVGIAAVMIVSAFRGALPRKFRRIPAEMRRGTEREGTEPALDDEIVPVEPD
jgi:hypothetical protein